MENENKQDLFYCWVVTIVMVSLLLEILFSIFLVGVLQLFFLISLIINLLKVDTGAKLH